MQFEYKIKIYSYISTMEANLDDMGKYGWELVSFTNTDSNQYLCIFKRQKNYLL